MLPILKSHFFMYPHTFHVQPVGKRLKYPFLQSPFSIVASLSLASLLSLSIYCVINIFKTKGCFKLHNLKVKIGFGIIKFETFLLCQILNMKIIFLRIKWRFSYLRGGKYGMQKEISQELQLLPKGKTQPIQS